MPTDPSETTPPLTPVTHADTAAATSGVMAPAIFSRRWLFWLTAAIVLLVSVNAFLWQKLAHIQSELARSSTDSTSFAMEARATAKAAQDMARETATRLGVAESKLAEVGLQRGQLEELMQSLSRSRDENLVVDMDAAVRLAQQQSHMLGSVEPLLAALKTAEQRIARASQPRLTPIARAIAKDMDKLRTAKVLDIGRATLALDEISRMVDELPLAQDLMSNTPAPVKNTTATSTTAQAMHAMLNWTERFWKEVQSLVRVSTIDTPEAALLTPSQSYFARENLKLKLLNARLGLLSHQLSSAGSDLQSAQQALSRFYDRNAKGVQLVREKLAHIQTQLQTSELPRLDDTLTALATAAAAR